ncbi:Wzz/FepE/Etk N-terminal domain-containing protein [Pedobacter sp. JY14-1]|uniref:Wzz/FepE/Etk N-terminal domain-containing protein n=1 Tax=Pedobacter sp. JY14-1 TaxID=3034151 RepID=UPI0023E1C296|nr:Wzz/FepE/Etk N-terminal domain-containing protein [Pedobacter sp. JY14-1]
MKVEELNPSDSPIDSKISLKELILRFQDWIRFLWAHKIPIILVGLAGGVIGFLYAYYKKPIYSATTSFALEEDKPGGFGSLAGLASIAGIDLGSGGGSIFQGDNILELYKSRNMIKGALFRQTTYGGKRELLINRFIDFNELQESWDNKPRTRHVKFTHAEGLNRVQDSLLTLIIDNIRTDYLAVNKIDKKLSIINATISSTDEVFSKAFNEAIVTTVNDFYVRTKTKKSAENVAILQQKADSVRNVMNGAIYSAVAANDATPNLNPTRQVIRVVPSQRAQFSVETNKAVLSVLLQNLEMSKTALMKETPLIQIIDEPVFPLEKKKVGKIKGTFYGGLLAGIFVIFFLTLRKFMNIIMK